MDISAEPTHPRVYHVLRVQAETYDTYSLELRSENNSGHAFLPGQFNMLYAFGVGEVPISISGDPSDSERLVHTVRVVGPVTRALCSTKVGMGLAVTGPFGSHWPMEDSAGRDVMIVAGGIGLAPLRPAVYDLLSHREEYGRVFLLYGARTPQDLLYRVEMARWRRKSDFDVQITVDAAKRGWRGNVGVVPALIPKAAIDPPNTIALLCGPEIMIRFAVKALERRSVPEDQIFVSLERNMKCGMGLCGHCQLGPRFVCKDGPVFRYDTIRRFMEIREI